jgi:hypothetical protein
MEGAPPAPPAPPAKKAKSEVEEDEWAEPETTKGKKMFRDSDGFLYWFHRHGAAGTTQWRCAARGCGGRVRVEPDGVSSCPTAHHNHLPDSLDSAVRAVKTGLKRKAAEEGASASTRSIVGSVLASRSDTVLAALPARRSLLRATRRTKRGKGVLPAEPSSSDWDVPDVYRSLNGETFLFCDFWVGNEHRVQGWATPGMLAGLEMSEGVYVDATFKAAPSQSYQLWVLHAVLRGYTIPCAFFIMDSKKEACYRACLRALTQLLHRWNPTWAMMDFELAEASAFASIFPACSVLKCWFHLRQSIQRKVQELGLVSLVGRDEEAAMLVKQLACFSFLPPGDVEERWDEWVTSLGEVGDGPLQPLFDYFQKNYVLGAMSGLRRRRPPLFPPPSWNHYLTACNGGFKTNNAAEAWNKAFTGMLSKHKSTWELLDCLQKEAGLSRLDLAAVMGGRDPPKRSKKYVEVGKRLQNLCLHYNDYPTLTDFLRYAAVSSSS